MKYIEIAGENNIYDGDEFMTPLEIAEASRMTLVDIDLDPASTELSNEVIGAKNFLTKDQDALNCKYAWNGAVFLNPPFSAPLVGEFCNKLLDQIDLGNTRRAILLVNTNTSSKWQQRLLARLATREVSACFPKRISFSIPIQNAYGKRVRSPAIKGNRFDQIIFYFHKTKAESVWFNEVFSAFGVVV